MYQSLNQELGLGNINIGWKLIFHKGQFIGEDFDYMFIVSVSRDVNRVFSKNDQMIYNH